MTTTTSQMVEAIRGDEKVGRGTCSVIDECYTDAELTDFVVGAKCKTIKAAVKAARGVQSAHDGYDCGMSASERAAEGRYDASFDLPYSDYMGGSASDYEELGGEPDWMMPMSPMQLMQEHADHEFNSRHDRFDGFGDPDPCDNPYVEAAGDRAVAWAMQQAKADESRREMALREGDSGYVPF